MFDLEREQLRKTYELCRLGFGITAGALALACFMSVLDLFGFFQPELLVRIHSLAWYQWLNTPIVWGSLIGTTLLWGRWDHASWQRRAGVLLFMCSVDLALWFVARGDGLGLPVADVGHGWLRENAGIALGWGEFALLSSLSCDYLVHLGVDHASDSDKSTRSMTATGALVWMLLFSQQTEWGAGWPLKHRRPVNLEGQLLMYGFILIWTITLIQVTALVISAVRQSTHVLEEMDREDQQSDLLRSRSDSHHGFEGFTAYGDKRDGAG